MVVESYRIKNSNLRKSNCSIAQEPCEIAHSKDVKNLNQYYPCKNVEELDNSSSPRGDDDCREKPTNDQSQTRKAKKDR